MALFMIMTDRGIMKAYVLFSGGIDSTACIKFYLDLGYEVEAIFCDYNQPANNQEEKTSREIADFYEVPYRVIKTIGIAIPAEGEIIGRNAMLIIHALLSIGKGVGKIIIGTHADSLYTDCSDIFLNKMTSILDLYTGGTVVVEAPFQNWNREEIIEYCLQKDVPIKRTYSCERGSFPPCGECGSCVDRKELD